MRDPRGSLTLNAEFAQRSLHQPLEERDFLRTALARDLVNKGLLVDFEIRDAQSLRSPRLPFVTFPDEWCDAQALDAAQLTLTLQAEANRAGYDLKDASAWNVIFDGSRPTFCDLLSFETLEQRAWWAAGQFSRHFLLPLLLSRKVDFRVSQSFRVWRDGVPSEAARAMLGPARFFTRYWPLMAHSRGSSRASLVQQDAETLSRHRKSLNVSLLWMLEGVAPPSLGEATTWSTYEELRGHYAKASLNAKRAMVRGWLERIKPSWVADFGCNAGEFSQIAHECGASVVALDADHGAIQRLYLRRVGQGGIYPMLVTLDDLTGGRGWAGEEWPGAAERFNRRFDVVMMLALIHHLAISNAVRLADVARFAFRCTKQWAIVEWLDAKDPLVQKLCVERRRDSSEFTLELQRQAFVDAGFVVEALEAVPETHRVVALLRRG